MAETLVRYAESGATALVTLSRPEKLNALTAAMLDELEVIARKLDVDQSIRSVILTGSGEKAFCVGADINQWSELAPLDMWRRWVKRGHQVFDQWARLRQPVIVALNGHAFGGGLELAITGDIRISSDAAQYALPEASIATCPGWSGTQRLVQLVGASHGKYLALTGRRIKAGDAHATGLVHEVAPAGEVFERAMACAREMADKAPISIQLTKQLLNAAAGEAVGATLEGMAGALAAHTLDAAEGVKSFQEKRAPQYQGR
ncbi:enoyl-CoA hydratase/isomerase family protein [Piscinibacter sp. HJYY11]|uniref:enoyl-CoA hydratase/isomerase family protein n=1 Tax=Piscinibacter sp. HJYY11 TaxID=2801333 RepID=UPI00191E1496|nr:enoyl-CoA hydratase-related protein [Piscinibacter sp. HJYY11]MBL0729616.1 enoyl-CoA hydratase/isomerase family protein [Piscinibacter sp. HJYY11]